MKLNDLTKDSLSQRLTAYQTWSKTCTSFITNIWSCSPSSTNPFSMPLLFFSRRFLIFSTIIPFIASITLYRLDTFDPSHLPADALVYSTTSIPPLVNDQLLTGAEFIGVGLLNKPEDIAYDRDSGLIYTGCLDGWVKRVKVMESANDSVVENWVNTGGRPLGLAFGLHGEVIVADAYKGMFNISDDGRKTELLTDEAEGVRFKLTDAVAVGDNGVLYFTDASYKYDYSQSSFDVLEGKPHGRLMSFNPTTRTTRVLLKDLYFANGVSMSPDQTHLVFCETPCSVLFLNSIISSLCAFIESYHFKVVFLLLSEEDAASTTSVRSVLRYLFKAYRVIQITFGYDGDGHYWIAMPTGVTTLWKLSMRYPLLRKVTAMVAKWGFNLMFAEDAGVLQVDFDGNPIAFYHDHKITHLTTGVKIGKYLYCGSLLHSRILRLDLLNYPAQKSL